MQAAYFDLPATFPASAKPNPGDGATITWMGLGNSRPVIPLNKNKFWQEFNKRLGCNFGFDLPPSAADFPAKFATALAGGSLADIVNIHPHSPAHLPQVLESEFQELTDFLSGDAVKEYPNLANIPPSGWRPCVFNGKLFGIPCAAPNVGHGLYLNQGIRDNDIVPPDELSDGDDLIELCKAVTDEKKSQWAFGHTAEIFDMYQQMLGGPNVWAVEGGNFTYYAELPETKQALELTKSMWESGVVYPDAFGDSTSSYRMIPMGKVALIFSPAQQPQSGVSAFRPAAPDYTFVMYRLPKYEGGGWSRQRLGNGVLTMNALKKAGPERIKTILRVLDWIAGPFGSAEDHFLTYGVEGWDSKDTDGELVRTEVGQNEMGALPVRQAVRTVPSLAPPMTKEDQTKLHEYESAVIPDGLPDPLAGLYSDTDSSTGVTLNKTLGSVRDDIITGRKPLSAWDGAVKAWKQGGGDTIRKEYQEAYATANG